ncbi:MAG TPA: hypothetical protein PKE63_04985 [Lacibacter sp.]|nr:hypothetical protein [Lacibacter sp.]HMO90228.1 hypothetical protein [Lacibacter sp.]HMP86609.1 hypothetical protein [Lacibacter sp.]
MKEQPPFDTPVLFLIFNRPDTTARVWEQIRNLQPSRLFIAADGPRDQKPGETALCAQTRALVKQVDWNCEVKTLFREKNLGCGPAVSGAITWFFEQVDAGIILEDDCLPTSGFFQFCSNLLETYRHDTRVWHIAGYNLHPVNTPTEADYFFSQETPIWGWATWRRVWKHYHLKPDLLRKFETTNLVSFMKMTRLHAITSLYDFRKVAAGKVNTWDYQYSFYQLVNNGLSVIPCRNLVENIGFDGNATHTSKNHKHYTGNKAVSPDYSHLRHPAFVLADVSSDRHTYNKRTRILKRIYVYLWYHLIFPLQKSKQA